MGQAHALIQFSIWIECLKTKIIKIENAVPQLTSNLHLDQLPTNEKT